MPVKGDLLRTPYAHHRQFLVLPRLEVDVICVHSSLDVLVYARELLKQLGVPFRPQ
jgi:hypothetical protein